MDSMEWHINKIEEDIKAKMENIEALKESLSAMEAKMTQFNENIHHISRILKAFCDISLDTLCNINYETIRLVV